MNNMKEQFVTYEIALKLKKLGFDEPCFGRYEYKDSAKFDEIILQITHTPSQNTFSWQTASAPLWQQVVDWLREEYNIKIQIEPTHACYNIGIYKYYEDEDNNLELPTDGLNFKDFLNYYECREQAILKTIELINGRNI